MLSKRRSVDWVIRLGVALAPLGLIGTVWALNHQHLSKTTQLRPAAVTLTLAAIPKGRADLPTAPTPPTGAQESILLSQISLISVPAISGSTDPDPVASFRQLIAQPPASSSAPGTPLPETSDADLVILREPPAKPAGSSPTPVPSQLDPRTLRAVLDRGVVAYASSKTDQERMKGVSMIQAAALIGYFPARNLLARNYPQSAAVRSIVPANDAIRYAVSLVMDPTITGEDIQQVFLLLAHHFGGLGQMDLFATHMLDSLRGDTRPQLSRRVDTLLELLEKVPGACDALARLMITNGGSSQKNQTTLSEILRTYIEGTTAAEEEKEGRQRGLILVSQLSH